ncbi:MAG TPA: SNF2-related protein [bacterium]|nr:SNF2-related protein [bacterium]
MSIFDKKERVIWNMSFNEDGISMNLTINTIRVSLPLDIKTKHYIEYYNKNMLMYINKIEAIDSFSDIFNANRSEINIPYEYIYEGLEKLNYEQQYESDENDSAEIVNILNDIADIPPIYPLKIKIKTNGTFKDKQFSMMAELYEPPSIRVLTEPVGASIKLNNGNIVLLQKEQYYLLKDMKAIMPDDEIGKMRYWGVLREKAIRAKAELDPYLKNEILLTIDKIKPIIKPLNDGRAMIDIDIQSDKTHELNIKFNKFDKVQDKYNLDSGNNTERIRIIPTDNAREALNNIKRRPILQKNEFAKFLANPEAIFPEKGFDLSEYSDRVIEIGEYKYSSIRFLVSDANKMEWLDWDESIEKVPPLIIQLDGDSEPIEIDISNDEIWENIKDKVRQAAIEGSDYVEIIPKHFVPINQLPEELVSAIDKYNNENNKDKRKIYSLIIKNNVYSLECGDQTLIKCEECQIFTTPPTSIANGVKLYQHQLEGYSRMYWITQNITDPLKGFLLADDMGLGKTLQVICVLAKNISQGIEGKHLLVAPISLLENWNSEITRYYPGVFSTYWLPGKHFNPDMIKNNTIVMTSYETLRERQLELGKIPWQTMIIDEAQKTKNVNTRISNAIKAMKAKNKFALTGTPIENSFSELWNILDFVQPGYLGSLKEFHKKYILPWKNASNEQKVVLSSSLQNDIKPLFLRRNKVDVLNDLPKKHLQTVRVGMGELQKQYYHEEIIKYNRDINTNMIGTILRLIAICSHPALIYETMNDFKKWIEDCPKMKLTIDILKQIKKKDEKALIFTRFRKLQMMMKIIIENIFGINAYVINGQTPPNKRQEIVDTFSNTPNFNVLILGPRAAGFGLNIVAANHVVFYTREWNPAVESQAIDRTYRIGQKKDVYVYYPFVSDSSFITVEEKIHQLLQQKMELQTSIGIMPQSDITLTSNDFIEILKKEHHEDDARILNISDIDKLGWEYLERTGKVIFERKGYKVNFTPKTGDAGIDLVCRNLDSKTGVLVQSKHRTDSSGRSIGNDAVQQVVAGKKYYQDRDSYIYKELYVITNGEFTSSAKRLARSNGVKLIGRQMLQRMLAEYQIKLYEVL